MVENKLQVTNHDFIFYKDGSNVFLKFNGREILENAGSISNEVANELAYKEYEKFRIKQDKLYVSDFDKFLETMK